MYARIIQVNGKAVDHRTKDYKTEKGLMKHGVNPYLYKINTPALVETYVGDRRIKQELKF